MASYKKIFALIVIITLAATSTATRNRIVPEEILYNGHSTVIGERDPNENDYVAFAFTVTRRAKLLGWVELVQTFHTWRQETITQIRVEDPGMRLTGGRVEVINNGPGSQNVTLKFYSSFNSGIYKDVVLYGL